MDFCPRCGRNLRDDEYVCPECGNVVREPPTSQTQTSEVGTRSLGGAAPNIFLIVGFLVMFVLTYFVGVYFLFFFIPVVMFGGRRSRTQMLFIGAMAGTVVGLFLKFLF